MKLLFANSSHTNLADQKSTILYKTREVLLCIDTISEVMQPELADAIIIQEVQSYKDFRYIRRVLEDPFLAGNIHKVFTINSDDCATGLLRGIYTCLPKQRFKPGIHACVPYMEYPNELIFCNFIEENDPLYLASWRGNTKSNQIRLKMIDALTALPGYGIETTDSWFSHGVDEKWAYVNLIRASKFSLCPAGWAPVSFRIYESMALGKCPVIIADNFVPPPGPDWKSFALFYPEKKMDRLHTFLLQHEKNYWELGKKAYAAWSLFFSPKVIGYYYAHALAGLIEKDSLYTREGEIRRWRSLSFYWSNNWTLSQRVFNKLKNKHRAEVITCQKEAREF